jgi:hypothetical protein
MIDDDGGITHYVACAAWLRKRAPELLDDFIEEVMRGGGFTDEDWNDGCARLADYARRKGDAGDDEQFVALVLE